MSDIFISYSHEDRNRAREIADRLEQEGWSVFWDRTIPVASPWNEYLEKELSSARIIVVLWSKVSVASRFVFEEASRGNDRNALVPAVLEHVTIPLGFGLLQYADLSEWKSGGPDTEGMRLLIEAVARKGKLKISKEIEEMRRAEEEKEAQRLDEQYDAAHEKGHTELKEQTKKKFKNRKFLYLVLLGVVCFVTIYIVYQLIISSIQNEQRSIIQERDLKNQVPITPSQLYKTQDGINFRLIVKDLFDQQNSWEYFSDKKVVDGVFRWEIERQSESGFTMPFPHHPPGNFYMAVDVRIASMAGRIFNVGIYFRHTGSSLYYLTLNPYGYFSLKLAAGYEKTLQDWTYVPNIQIPKFNRLAVAAVDDTIRIYVNDRPYGLIEDGTSLFGVAGFFIMVGESIGGDATGKATVEFDNFELGEIINQ